MSRNRTMNLAAILLVVGGLVTAVVYGQERGPGHSAPDHSGMMMNQAQWMDAMEQMGMSEGMMMRSRMLTAARVDAYDPASVLAYQVGLNLSEDQVKKIQAIAEKARKEVKAVLTAEQIAQLEPMASGPQSMTQMHQHMERMRQRQNGKGDTGMMMMGPMMWGQSNQPDPGNTQQRQMSRMMSCPMRS